MMPKRDRINSVVHDCIAEQRTVELRELYDQVARRLDLTEADLAMKDPRGDNLFQHEVRWALQTLKRQGHVANGDEKGIWRLA